MSQGLEIQAPSSPERDITRLLPSGCLCYVSAFCRNKTLKSVGGHRSGVCFMEASGAKSCSLIQNNVSESLAWVLFLFMQRVTNSGNVFLRYARAQISGQRWGLGSLGGPRLRKASPQIIQHKCFNCSNGNYVLTPVKAAQLWRAQHPVRHHCFAAALIRLISLMCGDQGLYWFVWGSARARKSHPPLQCRGNNEHDYTPAGSEIKKCIVELCIMKVKFLFILILLRGNTRLHSVYSVLSLVSCWLITC